MDSNTLEKERGITILSKYTSFRYRDYLINAVDTPGHADFGGEVERVLGMVDGALLLVDASEGPLAQTKFVLEKALKRGIRPIVVLNKVDRESATPERCAQVETQLFDLFAQLGANDDQLNFSESRLLYASAKQGWASPILPHRGQAPPGASMTPLMEAILREVPSPLHRGPGLVDKPFSMLVSMIERDPYLGKIAAGRVATGRLRVGDKVHVLRKAVEGEGEGEEGEAGTEQPAANYEAIESKVTRIFKRIGTERVQVEETCVGDIVAIAGASSARITDTLASPEHLEGALDPGPIDPPTLSMIFSPNDSPLAGRAGKAVTGRVIGERLMAEAETSVSLKVKAVEGGSERYEVRARGELQLGVLIENMRREGMELAVSPPRVLLRNNAEGKVEEPIEEVMCEVADEVAGSLIESLGLRKGELINMEPLGQGTGKQRLTFVVPSRGMIGFKSIFVNLTRGEGILARSFKGYESFKGQISGVRKGVLVSTAEGRTTLYAMGDLQSRGVFFIQPQTEVYCGMIVGENSKAEDMDVNPVKEKKLTNVRSVQADDKVFLSAPRLMNLEESIGYISGSELVEVTPDAVRIRKEVLDPNQRKILAKKAASTR